MVDIRLEPKLVYQPDSRPAFPEHSFGARRTVHPVGLSSDLRLVRSANSYQSIIPPRLSVRSSPLYAEDIAQ